MPIFLQEDIQDKIQCDQALQPAAQQNIQHHTHLYLDLDHKKVFTCKLYKNDQHLYDLTPHFTPFLADLQFGCTCLNMLFYPGFLPV